MAWMMVFGRFSDKDECWYKETGRQWAVNGHWANPAIQGFLPDLQVPPEVVHFTQPPVYAFMFGLFVKVAGFGWRQCVFFDAVIRMMMALLAGRAVRKIGGPSIPAVVPWATSLGFLLVDTPTGRPDALAVCFGILGLLLLLDQSIDLRRVIGSGVLFGLCVGTNLVGGCIMATIAVPLLLLATPSWRNGLFLCLAWGAIMVITLGLIVAPIVLSAPGCLEQFRAHWRLHVRSRPSLVVIQKVLDRSGSRAVILLGTLPAAFVVSLRTLRFQGLRDWIRLWAGPVLAFLAWFIVSSQKEFYLIFVATWLFVITTGELGRLWSLLQGHVRWLSAGILICILTLVDSRGVKVARKLVLPTDQTPAWNERWLQNLIPAGSRVIASRNSWWFLTEDRTMYDGSWAGPNLDTIDFVVLTWESFKSRDGSRIRPSFKLSSGPLKKIELLDHFRLLASNYDEARPGFGAMVFERIPTAARDSDVVIGRRAGVSDRRPSHPDGQ